MFDKDKWQEIFSTIGKNKLRSFLTAFSVALGIFMLILLMGAGTGLENGFREQFSDDAKNAMWLYPGVTSKAFNGLQTGREIQFHDDDKEFLEERFSDIGAISSEIGMNWSGGAVNYGSNFGSYSIKGVHPEHMRIEFRKMTSGRFINEVDVDKNRKICVIGQAARKELFENDDPIGKYIHISQIPFKVVGTFEEDLGQNDRGKVYIPITTCQRIYGQGTNVDELMFTIEDVDYDESIQIASNIIFQISKRHDFDPTDPRALYVQNNLENFKMFSQIFDFLRIFIWVIAIGSLISGIIGVGNIMLVVVKERTFEIGVRKAIGATPYSIVSLIMLESIFITSIAGFFGLTFGIGVLELYNSGAWLDILQVFGILSDFSTDDISAFKNPSVDTGLMINAAVFLVICGSLAGLPPSLKAARIKPIVALRQE